jgi:hypothetical protein
LEQEEERRRVEREQELAQQVEPSNPKSAEQFLSPAHLLIYQLLANVAVTN